MRWSCLELPAGRRILGGPSRASRRSTRSSRASLWCRCPRHRSRADSPWKWLSLGDGSVREYTDRMVTLPELGRLLHYVTGITDRRDSTLAFRAVPSSGALFPIEVYPAVFEVAGLQPGVYHKAVQRYALELVRAGDFRQDVFNAAVSQEMIRRASFVAVLTGIFG